MCFDGFEFRPREALVSSSSLPVSLYQCNDHHASLGGAEDDLNDG